MRGQLLKIHWGIGNEYVPIPEGAERTIITKEDWNKMGMVTYNPTLEQLDLGKKRNVIELRYKRDEQVDRNVRDSDYARWGKSRIWWSPSRSRGKAQWSDDNDLKYSGIVDIVDVDILGGEPPVGRLKKSVSVIVKARPKQKELRDQLIYLDKSCAISGEEQRAAIEAAHIVPVKADGQEVISNAFLLRADLHRLFDAGLFWFELTDCAYVKFGRSLSPYYSDLLAGKSLPKKTFERVGDALRLRAMLPDSKGPGIKLTEGRNLGDAVEKLRIDALDIGRLNPGFGAVSLPDGLARPGWFRGQARIDAAPMKG